MAHASLPSTLVGVGPVSGRLSGRSWVWGRRWAIYPEASTRHGTERSISGPTRNGGWKPLRKVAPRGAGSLKRAAPRPWGPGAHLKRPVSWPAPLKTYTPAVGTRETRGPALPTRPGQRATGDMKAGPPGQSSQAATFSHLPGTLSHVGPPLPHTLPTGSLPTRGPALPEKLSLPCERKPAPNRLFPGRRLFRPESRNPTNQSTGSQK